MQFTRDVFIKDAHVSTLNDMAVEDFLSVSEFHDVDAVLNVDTIQVTGNVTCPHINGIDLNDLLFIDDDDMQITGSPLVFANNVTVHHLTIEDGTLNDLDVERLLDPETLRIDSPVIVAGAVRVDSMETGQINDVDITDIDRKYWTKSTEQVIDVEVTLPADVKMLGNVETKTFLKGSLEQDFYLTTADENVYSDVVFDDVVTVDGRLTVEDLQTIAGVDIHALDNDVVKKEGTFHITGTKV